jgi:peptide/nickel transport system permease protein
MPVDALGSASGMGRRRFAGGSAWPLVKLVGRRLLLGIVIMFVITILVFVTTEALPGTAAVVKLGRAATPEAIQAFNAHYHLNDPLLSQYFLWLGDLVRGHFGASLITSVPVTSLVGQRIVNSLALMLCAGVIGFPLALVIGFWSAKRRDGRFDHTVNGGLLALAALPEFVLGIGLLVVLATNVTHVLPAASLLNPQKSVWSQLQYLVLPALVLALVNVPYIARLVRASMIEVLESDYVAMARLNGLSERRVLWRHAAVNAAGPTVQAIGLTLAYLAGGDVIVETVFQYPGVGLAFYEAILNRDLPVIQALTLLTACAVVVLNIGADVVTILVSPRLRTRLR